MAQCWRFTGESTDVGGGGENIKYELFACGDIPYYEVYTNSDSIYNGFVRFTIDGKIINEDIFVLFETRNYYAVDSDEYTAGYQSSGKCSSCLANKYDRINGICTPQETFSTPGLYNSLSDCEDSNDAKLTFVSISIPVFSSCNSNNEPIYIQQDVRVIKGTEDAESLKFQELANTKGEIICNNDCVASVPDGWQIRPEYHRPQVIYQFGEVNDQGHIVGPPMYSISVPHHIADKPSAGLPQFRKGNWETIYVLKDNSKITIFAYDESNAKKILTAIKERINPEYLKNSYLSKCGEVVTDTPIKTITVKCRMAKYYAQGNKKNLPDWLVKF